MALPLQLFGTVETGEENAQAMLCMDVDRPEEAMLHWWGDRTPPEAALVSFLRKSEGEIELEPKLSYRTNPNGSLLLPELSKLEIEHIQGFRGILQEKDEQLEGEWTHLSGTKGCISFSATKCSSDLVPEKCTNWNEFKDWSNRAEMRAVHLSFEVMGAIAFASGPPYIVQEDTVWKGIATIHC